VNRLSDGDPERQFCSRALQYLTTISGRQVEIQNWLITSYEVEFGPQIGSGGLYVHIVVTFAFASLIPSSQQRTSIQGYLE
jgi:hypothetical protein